MDKNMPGIPGPGNDREHTQTPIADALTRADGAAERGDFRRAIGELAEAISLTYAREIFTARRFIVAGPDGKPAIELGTDDRGEPRIRILDRAGKVRAELSTDSGDPALRLMAPDGETRARLSVGTEAVPAIGDEGDCRSLEVVAGLFLGGLASRPKMYLTAGNAEAGLRMRERTGETAVALTLEEPHREGDLDDVIASLALTPGGVLPAEEPGDLMEPKRRGLALHADGSGAIRIDGVIKTDARPSDWPMLEMSLTAKRADLALRTAEAIVHRVIEGGDLAAFEARRSAVRYGSEVG